VLDVAHRLDELRGAAASPGAPPEEDDGDVVPIESLDYDADVVPIASLAPDSGFERSFATLGRLERERPAGAASLDGLLGRATQVRDAVAEDAVGIETLCYRGRAALERADTVRGEIAAALARREQLESLQPLIRELLDLVPLALVER
jgi:hypothetical protein